MIGKISSKFKFLAVFGVIFIILTACFMPLDDTAFLESKEVQEIINHERVTIVMPGGSINDPIRVTGTRIGGAVVAAGKVMLSGTGQGVTLTASGGTGNYTWVIVVNGTESDISSLAETTPADGSVLILDYAMFLGVSEIITAGADPLVDTYDIFVEDSLNYSTSFTVNIKRP